MFGSEILEVAIGIVFVYLITSLVATSVREAIEGILKTRAIQLERGIRQILDDPTGTGFTQKVLDHPLLYSLYAGKYDPGKQLTNFFIKMRRGGAIVLPNGQQVSPQRLRFFTNLPAYIPSSNFALALMHTVSSGGPLTIESFQQGAMLLPEGRLKDAMLVILGEAKGDLDRARKSVEAWFDGTMDRVAGWYKRETSWILFGLGLLTAVALNVDTLAIARTLTSSNTVRQQLIAHVDTAYPATEQKRNLPSQQDLDAEIAGLSDLIGWDGLAASHRSALTRRSLSEQTLKDAAARDKWVDDKLADSTETVWFWLAKILGWLLSALAISLGAPFWFDTLNKLMVIRSTVKPYEKSPPEASADRGAVVTRDSLLPSEASSSSGETATAPIPASGAALMGNDVSAKTVALRYAFDGADPGSITVGVTEPVPESGFIELILAVGVEQTITATGTKNGQTVAWKDVRVVGPDDEQKPVAATLA